MEKMVIISKSIQMLDDIHPQVSYLALENYCFCVLVVVLVNRKMLLYLENVLSYVYTSYKFKRN